MHRSLFIPLLALAAAPPTHEAPRSDPPLIGRNTRRGKPGVWGWGPPDRGADRHVGRGSRPEDRARLKRAEEKRAARRLYRLDLVDRGGLLPVEDLDG